MKVSPKSVLGRVTLLLEKKKSNRDDDNKLLANIWWRDLEEQGLDPEKYKELLALVAEGKLTNVESVVRARRKLQEENEHLRGTNYNERLKNTEEIKKEIRDTPAFQMAKDRLGLEEIPSYDEERKQMYSKYNN